MIESRNSHISAVSPIEFIALMAMLVAVVAFSIDSLLPALPDIAQEFSPDRPNRAQFVLTGFFVGMGVGTFFTGPLSDTYGRKPVIVFGSLLYIFGAVLAWAAPSLELLVFARVIQGLGAAAPRIVSLAIIRDLYSGREMARLVSFIMIIFTLVPAVAPLGGAAVIAIAGWRGIFVSFVLFLGIAVLWLAVRQDETLPVSDRRDFNFRSLLAATQELFANPIVRLSIIVQTFCFSTLVASIILIQPVFDIYFGRNESFPLWFFLGALIAGLGSFLNARLVMRIGMRGMVTTTLTIQIFLTVLMIAIHSLGPSQDWEFPIYFIWQIGVFFQAGLTLGNLNALGMEPMGHIAGLAASIIAGVATIGAAVLTTPIGLAFDGTPVPLFLGVLGFAIAGRFFMARMRRFAENL